MIVFGSADRNRHSSRRRGQTGRVLSAPVVRFLHVRLSQRDDVFTCTALALVLVNSVWTEAYDNFWHTHLSIAIGFWTSRCRSSLRPRSSRGEPIVERLTPHAARAILSRLGPRANPEATGGNNVEASGCGIATSANGALVHYPPETAGGIMEPRVASLAVDYTAQEGMTALRRTPQVGPGSMSDYCTRGQRGLARSPVS